MSKKCSRRRSTGGADHDPGSWKYLFFLELMLLVSSQVMASKITETQCDTFLIMPSEMEITSVLKVMLLTADMELETPKTITQKLSAHFSVNLISMKFFIKCAIDKILTEDLSENASKEQLENAAIVIEDNKAIIVIEGVAKAFQGFDFSNPPPIRKAAIAKKKPLPKKRAARALKEIKNDGTTGYLASGRLSDSLAAFFGGEQFMPRHAVCIA